jgi:hypothetical protein
MAIDATQAIQTVLDTCKNCETIEEMLDALRDLAKNPQNGWVNQVLDMINAPGNENLKKKFYRHFRKDALNYSIAQVKFDKKTGKRIVETRIVNTKSAYDTITQSLGASFRNGSVGSYTINRVAIPIVQRVDGNNVLTPLGEKTVAEQIKKDIGVWEGRIKQLYKKGTTRGDMSTTDYVAQQIQEQEFDGKTIVQAVTEILKGIGVMVPQDVVLNTMLGKIGKGYTTSNAGKLLRMSKVVIDELKGMNDEKSIPNGLKGNKAGRGYFPILKLVADSVQEFVEASVYQDGKTYYSYTNPSRLGHIIRNLKNAMEDPDKFEKYIQDQYGRYKGWFQTADGQRLNPEEEGSEWLWT